MKATFWDRLQALRTGDDQQEAQVVLEQNYSSMRKLIQYALKIVTPSSWSAEDILEQIKITVGLLEIMIKNYSDLPQSILDDERMERYLAENLRKINKLHRDLTRLINEAPSSSHDLRVHFKNTMKNDMDIDLDLDLTLYLKTEEASNASFDHAISDSDEATRPHSDASTPTVRDASPLPSVSTTPKPQEPPQFHSPIELPESYLVPVIQGYAERIEFQVWLLSKPENDEKRAQGVEVLLLALEYQHNAYEKLPPALESPQVKEAIKTSVELATEVLAETCAYVHQRSQQATEPEDIQQAIELNERYRTIFTRHEVLIDMQPYIATLEENLTVLQAKQGDVEAPRV